MKKAKLSKKVLSQYVPGRLTKDEKFDVNSLFESEKFGNVFIRKQGKDLVQLEGKNKLSSFMGTKCTLYLPNKTEHGTYSRIIRILPESEVRIRMNGKMKYKGCLIGEVIHSLSKTGNLKLLTKRGYIYYAN